MRTSIHWLLAAGEPGDCGEAGEARYLVFDPDVFTKTCCPVTFYAVAPAIVDTSSSIREGACLSIHVLRFLIDELMFVS